MPTFADNLRSEPVEPLPNRMPGNAGMRWRNTGIPGHFDAEKARKCPEKPGKAGNQAVLTRCRRACLRLLTNVDVC
jgi:hypothetical protein